MAAAESPIKIPVAAAIPLTIIVFTVCFYWFVARALLRTVLLARLSLRKNRAELHPLEARNLTIRGRPDYPWGYSARGGRKSRPGRG